MWFGIMIGYAVSALFIVCARMSYNDRATKRDYVLFTTGVAALCGAIGWLIEILV